MTLLQINYRGHGENIKYVRIKGNNIRKEVITALVDFDLYTVADVKVFTEVSASLEGVIEEARECERKLRLTTEKRSLEARLAEVERKLK